MKHVTLTVMVLSVIVTMLAVQTAYARNTLHKFPVKEAIDEGLEEGHLTEEVKLYFDGQKHPTVVKSFGEFKTNKKTNAFNKSDKRACVWVLFSALKSLQDRALKEGGNAVINIKSNYKNNEFSSPIEYQCGAGAFLAGVALKGTVAKVK